MQNKELIQELFINSYIRNAYFTYISLPKHILLQDVF